MTLEIPGYKIVRPLAEGGMATVYLAIQKSLGRHVVLKLLKKFDSHDQFLRFLNEGQIIASLNHRNIITIHDIGVTSDNRPYISMEYLQGGDLEAKIEKGVDEKEALKITEAISDCLIFVHGNGIIHRDIKPANILFHEDNTPVLTDFGVAKQEQSDSNLTMDGSALGSPYYISPEQAESRKLDGRTDIYGLGIVLYEMLTGEKPYQGDSHIETIVAHLSDPLPLLPEKFARYQELIARMIAKSPDDRFSNADELLRYVRKLLEADSDHANSALPGRKPLAIADNLVAAFKGINTHLPGSLQSMLAQGKLLTSGINKWIVLGGIPVLSIIVWGIISPGPQSDTTAVENEGSGTVVADKPGVAGNGEKAEIQAAQRDTTAPISSEPGVENTALTLSISNVRLIDDYLLKAELAYQKNHLTTPKNDNAYAYYQKVLRINPSNEAASNGLTAVANRYADLAESAFDKFNYVRGTKYIEVGLRVDPDNPRLLDLQKNTSLLKDVTENVIEKLKSLSE